MLTRIRIVVTYDTNPLTTPPPPLAKNQTLRVFCAVRGTERLGGIASPTTSCRSVSDRMSKLTANFR
ncbi:MAG: hypothetical protein OXI96_11100 [Acidimicrobiaceae bacterium]|nr:hypothetical protein [Acidimicrobiaceae bacterium]